MASSHLLLQTRDELFGLVDPHGHGFQTLISVSVHVTSPALHLFLSCHLLVELGQLLLHESNLCSHGLRLLLI